MRRAVTSVLFACSQNAIRSPIAAALLRRSLGHRLYVDSVGVSAAPIDPFAVAVMREIGIDISNHVAKTFDELEDTSFDLILSLSPNAQHTAVELTRTMDCALEFWPCPDPSLIEASRESQLAAYRELRDYLRERISVRFPS